MANIRTVDLDGSVNPTVLASLLGLNTNSLYTARASGKILDWSGGKHSYAECVLSYISTLEKQARGNIGSLGEMLTEETISLTRTKRENMLLDMKIKKQEYGSYLELKELIEPIFHVINAGLNNLTRRFSSNPDLVKSIDTLLETLGSLGHAIETKANEDAEKYILEKMAVINRPEPEEIVDNVNEQFNLNQSLEALKDIL